MRSSRSSQTNAALTLVKHMSPASPGLVSGKPDDIIRMIPDHLHKVFTGPVQCFLCTMTFSRKNLRSLTLR